MKTLILRRMTRTQFDVAGDDRFTNATTLLVTDPPALRYFTTDRDDWRETPLVRDHTVDVSHFMEFEVRRIADDLVVRIGDDAWKAEGAAPIHVVFPLTLGGRPVSIGRSTI
jgi:hypothetical protein